MASATLLDPDFGGEFLVAAAAVEEVALHGGARLGHGAVADRIENLRVLLLEQIELATFGRRGRAAPDRAARDHKTSEIFQETLELWIVGGVGDLAMKRKILIDGGAAAFDGTCLLYTSDAADEEDSVDLGGRR